MTKILMNKNAMKFGILLVIAGYFLFAFNDAMSKILLTQLTIGQLLIFRSIGSVFVLAAIFFVERPSKTEFFTLKPLSAHVARMIFATLDILLFYLSVLYLPLTNILTFYMLGPIYIAIISHFFLKDHLKLWSWIAIFIGFIGVFIVLNPIDNKPTAASIFAFFAGLSFAILIVLNRYLMDTRDSIMVAWQNIFSLAIGFILIIWNWHPIKFSGSFFFLIVGTFACLGHLLISKSLKYIPATLVAPAEYTLIVWAVLFDYILFNHPPEFRILIGAMIIILSSGFVIYLQRDIFDESKKLLD